VSPAQLVERAPAKINLTLQVLGRRSDGYHMLDSLVAFAAVGDELTLEPGLPLDLVVSGPTAREAGPKNDNLVLRAAQIALALVPGLQAGRFRLLKRLPVAAGLGGGSSDAAAALRLLARLNRLDLDDPRLAEAARRTGSDVPVCLVPRTRWMRGAGELLSGPLSLPRVPAVLANPRVAAPTSEVFRALGLEPGIDLGAHRHPAVTATRKPDFVEALRAARNDLEAPAVAIAPVIRDALASMASEPACRLARMSGSGATVFGLFDSCRESAASAKSLRASQPGWWVVPTMIG
jgi:4-diphosphocytidyl-2-C-methyl-D-erythritol kinase